MTLSRQCRLLKVTRSVVSEQKKRLLKDVAERDLILLKLQDEEYTRHPFYGSRRMRRCLQDCGYRVNRKRVQRLIQQLGLVGMAPGPNTSKPHPQHKLYPYLLRGVDVIRPNQVWSNQTIRAQSTTTAMTKIIPKPLAVSSSFIKSLSALNIRNH
ncbi:IS3 family transposase [Methylomonas albis]|uniref:Transposase n=1 Tax=Methylomonas albis TaxID=1854563 RepID=A0ABR9D2E7_9GAMM|nr:IS3 family transposase [Methylomonas albis]MBD9357282.1 transposase [Methylomonas albis]